MPFPIVLLLAFLAQGAPSAPQSDALALLNEVSQRYADAKSYHIEAIKERTSSNELQHSWQKTLFTAIVMPGGRYRYEGRSAYSAAIVVSDGTTQWRYHLNEHRYTQQPASRKYPEESIISQEENATMEAADLVSEIAHRAHRLKSAVFLPDETISVKGNSVECYVVRYSDNDLKTLRSDLRRDETLWIDKSRKVLLKTLSRMETHVSVTPGVRIPMHVEETVTYQTVEFDQQEPASSFAFVAPPDAILGTESPNAVSKDVQPEADNLLGKSAPEVRFKSPEGKIIALSSFRGKPVFVEFWATWCVPCVDLMPDLSKLYLETQNRGLAWISVDSDEDSDDAAKFISREHIPWLNYHDEDGTLGKAFEREAIPLGVLIDADGKITFHRAGYDISDLRAAIAKLGPQFGSIASSSADSK
jgi:thiol-disulfide isomerase/thioredoxin/outer membrane lipoprotein-sorting protein